MSPMSRSSWLMEWPGAGSARHLLVCCHHAGGGAAQFRPWHERLGPDVAVLALQLPGRQNRWDEPPLQTMEAIIAGALPPLLARLDRPFTLFGHSMGGMVAFELARRLDAEYRLRAERLIVSATQPPHRHRGDLDLSGYDDQQLVRHFVANGTLPPWVLGDAELQALLLPPLRGDFAVCDEYRYNPGLPLTCPLTTCGGTEDDGVTADDLAGWRDYSEAGSESLMFTGRHLFHLDPGSGLLSTVARMLSVGSNEPRAQGSLA